MKSMTLLNHCLVDGGGGGGYSGGSSGNNGTTPNFAPGSGGGSYAAGLWPTMKLRKKSGCAAHGEVTFKKIGMEQVPKASLVTTCGMTGAKGPTKSDCDKHRKFTTSSSDYTVSTSSNGMQTVKFNTAGVYKLTAAGARFVFMHCWISTLL